MRRALSLIKKDIKQMTPAIIPVALYCLAAYLLLDTVCPLAALTGFPCPACGMSRAFCLLLKGQWCSAAKCNIMVIPWVLLAGYFVAARYFVRIRPIITELLLIAVCIATIAYYIYRLIYVYPSGPVMIYHENNLLTLALRELSK